MSIVNQETLARIKSERRSAYESDEWKTGYNRAMRGLDAAIAQLEQISHTTSGFSVEIVKR